ncbi:Ankyrin repeat domain-containing protein 34B [Labeo rohita]|uniref:Ankyrin repeat domain-containing protein 34B n=1 Tax=Labeo rohita TaxID=84645 RepID=A0ABQ8MKH3_LABRO|nr:Ankyrin repeat domain-containing protein 34B [Labeo rohita]
MDFADNDTSPTPDPMPRLTSPRSVERLPEPTADGEPKSRRGATELRIAPEHEPITSDQVREPGTSLATEEFSVEHEDTEEGPTHCTSLRNCQLILKPLSTLICLPAWISHPPSLFCIIHSSLPQPRHLCFLVAPLLTLSPPSVRWARHGSAILHRCCGWKIHLQPPSPGLRLRPLTQRLHPGSWLPHLHHHPSAHQITDDHGLQSLWLRLGRSSTRHFSGHASLLCSTASTGLLPPSSSASVLCCSEKATPCFLMMPPRVSSPVVATSSTGCAGGSTVGKGAGIRFDSLEDEAL